MSNSSFWDSVHVIDESGGVYTAILAYPHPFLLQHLLSEDWPYTWIHRHEVGGGDWAKWPPTLFDEEPAGLLTRFPATEGSRSWNGVVDLLLPTSEFGVVADHFTLGVRALQVQRPPAGYINPAVVRGKGLWRLLDECGWRFYLDTPCSDFGFIASRDRNVVERAVDYVEALIQNPEQERKLRKEASACFWAAQGWAPREEKPTTLTLHEVQASADGSSVSVHLSQPGYRLYVVLYTMKGERLRQLSQHYHAGTHHIELDVAGVPPGLYELAVRTPAERRAQIISIPG